MIQEILGSLNEPTVNKQQAKIVILTFVEKYDNLNIVEDDELEVTNYFLKDDFYYRDNITLRTFNYLEEKFAYFLIKEIFEIDVFDGYVFPNDSVKFQELSQSFQQIQKQFNFSNITELTPIEVARKCFPNDLYERMVEILVEYYLPVFNSLEYQAIA